MPFESFNQQPRTAGTFAPDASGVRTVEHERMSEETEVMLHAFLQDELNHYQSRMRQADDERQANRPPFPAPEPQDGAFPEDADGETTEEWHSLMGNYYLRHVKGTQEAQRALAAGDRTTVFRYLEEKIAQPDRDDERTPEELRRMRDLEIRIYRELHPEAQTGAPDRARMEWFFRSELAREELHNRREADSGLGGHWVEQTRDEYFAGNISGTIQLMESSLGEMAGLAEYHGSGGGAEQAHEDPEEPIWESDPARYAEELRSLWFGLSAERDHAAQ